MENREKESESTVIYDQARVELAVLRIIRQIIIAIATGFIILALIWLVPLT